MAAAKLDLPEPAADYLLSIRGRAEYWPLASDSTLAQCELVRCNALLGTRAHGATEHELAEVSPEMERIYCSLVHERCGFF